MSHFTVLVIGENPESQLEPFDENINAPEYQRELVSEEDKEKFLNLYQNYDPARVYAKITEGEAERNKTLSFDELYNIYGDDWNGNSWRKNEEGEWGEFSTYNPDSKWDWYQLGGRWTGFLKLKNGAEGEVGNFSLVSTTRADNGWCDQALKQDIDFEGMRDKSGNDARDRYNEVLIVFGGVIPKVEIKWSDICYENNPLYNILDWDEKRNLYNGQPAVKKANTLAELNRETLGHFFDVTDFDCTLEEYVQQARDNAISTFAILKDGVWYERGKMGWWAIVSDEKEKDVWNKEFSKLIDELSDDTLISLYDCHV